MNNYTHEELKVLNDMAICKLVSSEDQHNFFYSDGYYRLFDPSKIEQFTISDITQRFINFLSPHYYTKSNIGDICNEIIKKKLSHLFYKAPLEEMPLFIEKQNNMHIIAKWRLQIGK